MNKRQKKKASKKSMILLMEYDSNKYNSKSIIRDTDYDNTLLDQWLYCFEAFWYPDSEQDYHFIETYGYVQNLVWAYFSKFDKGVFIPSDTSNVKNVYKKMSQMIREVKTDV